MDSLLLSLNINPKSSNPPPLSQCLLPRYNLNRSKNLLLLNKPFSPKPRTSINCSSVSSLTPQLNKSPAQTLVFEEEKEEEKEEEEPLCEIWKEIQGCNDWEELLDPMNSHLRNEIIRYSKFFLRLRTQDHLF